MPTQDQQQYHFKLSDARCLCYTQTHATTFTFMHLADAFIQSDLQCIQAIHL